MMTERLSHISPLISAIDTLIAQQGHILIAIDGPCASGKSTLAAYLANRYNTSLFHMDDYFLSPEQRTEHRLLEAGGNVDRERFLNEILRPLSHALSISYRPYSCQSGTLGDAITVAPTPIAIVEGCYSLHPMLRDYYHLRVFLSAALPLRESRLLQRNGPEGLALFRAKWIPLENHYFSHCLVAQCCHIRVCLPNNASQECDDHVCTHNACHSNAVIQRDQRT